MSFMYKLKQLEKLTLDNSPVLLTAIGVVGTVTTAILTHKSTLAGTETLQIEDAYRLRDDPKAPPITRKEVFKLTWKHYIPPVVSGTVTVGAIIMANRIGSKRAAAVAAAYSLSETAFSEYREKVAQKFGESKAQGVRDDIARDRMVTDPPQESNIVLVGSGDVLCYDMFSGRYFNSSVEELKKAVNDTNYQINSDGYASLTDFWCRLGIPRTSISDEIGWNQDKLMDIEISTVLSEDGRPCVAYSFRTNPLGRFDQIHP